MAPEEVDEATEVPFHTFPGRDGTTILLGRSYAGRFLTVVLAEAADGRHFVCTAREMTQAEKREYRKKVRRS
ncbi:hypothetical protein [Nocardia sp. NPDC057227]|uniref:hypothetical protein n=1 Tax=Nocardia sp. NPDC057227 TaxID=3346056 RepID=UPI00363A8F44